MSARSAAARKKITTTQKKPAAPTAPSRRDPRAFVPAEYDYSYPYGQNGRFPPPPPPPESVMGTSSSGSQSAPSEIDDTSGIERSGFRTMLDKRSDGVRKGLAKTFAFRKKDKEDGPAGASMQDGLDRPESASTVRQNSMGSENDGYGYDRPTSSINTQQAQYYQQQHQQQQQQQPHYPYPYHHQSPVSPIDPWEIRGLGPPPAAQLPPVPQNNGPPIKRWLGGGRPPQRWNKLRKDPELWNPNGDVLVFLHDQGQEQPASFRMSSHVIEASENRWLITELRKGFTEDPDDIPSPPLPSYGSHGHPTPPISETDQLEGEISYEMHFPTPQGLNRSDRLRHHITTRNVFACLCRASLVGISLHQALTDLHARLERYRSHGEPDPLGQIIAYISSRAIDDTRNDPESAVGLLAWAERPGVRWSEGWREAFLHCAGMHLGGGLERCADWKYVAPQTRALLERSWLEMRLKVQTAEERLAEFAFGDIWSGGATSEFRSTPPVGSAKAIAERLQKMLVNHYTSVYGSWPPRTTAGGAGDEEEIWMTRTVARDLQRDFGALYDYLVDREVVWDVSEARAGRKWMMVSSGWNKGFDADVPGMPLTDIIIEFDNRLRLPHIPHPHPLLPASIPPAAPSVGGGGMFKSSSHQSSQHKQAGRDRRVALAYTESTNLDALDTSHSPSGLIDAFTRFEKNDAVSEVDPAMARKGRWVLLYGILQALAPVSVDAPWMRYTDGVTYHLSARLKKPSWSKGANGPAGAGLFGEVRHDMSHCWTAPASWVSETSEHTTDEGEGDGEGDDDDDDVRREEEDAFALPRSPPALSEAGSSERTSSTRRYNHHRRFNDAAGGDNVPRSRFFAQLPPVPGVDVMNSFLSLEDLNLGDGGKQQHLHPQVHHQQQQRTLKPGDQGYGSRVGTPLMTRNSGTPEIRDFDEDIRP